MAPEHLVEESESGAKSDLLVWGADGIEPNTIAEAQSSARLPFVESPVALMPDADFGFGATVGSVIATHGAIIPAAVGVDIGCGMCAARLNMHASQLPDNLGPLHGAIREAIPAGVGKAHEGQGGIFAQRIQELPRMVYKDEKLLKRAEAQHGTLGSGNHFVEVCLDEDEYVWLVLHSGSRGVGNEIAKHHIDGAKALMKQYFIGLDDPDLAYLVQGTPEFDEYIHDMLWAQEYARTNREAMMTAAVRAVSATLRTVVMPDVRVNCHHNYTKREHHHGKDLWVTRKGAIRAREGDVGIIPGSMATGTYIVEGLGNAASYNSASHGAGRRMSRGVARRTVTETELRDAMKGKVWNDRDAKALLDEAPAAYKNIGDVMAAQSDLVRIVHTLTQVLNYKGT